ncbi:hypothetical protein P168DRAFT_241715 [Aspergillus campestris IBT 28561]|uniref:Uncharacterized protein n=1 Tax=Aspergillus campestris (strain IBT 28561) TaxID=1392248 RepID=A0A2I1CVX8_ASPC2|nr:uncharacterized protein P168DRAFT_241715 [Aspergillus campestris IBT 28561]PKY01764.1 hypothetical protein P168DRAFT_241715 [Aspergillus campestris IBT 28561]
MDDPPRRVMVYARVTDIAGDPQRRHNSLGETFCKQILGRDFHAELQPSFYDHVHIPADFDSDQPLKRWFIFDLGVKQQLTAEAVAQMPHSVYMASRQNGELIFIRRDNWVDSAITRARSYIWGGRLEQRIVAEMRERYAHDLSV